VKYAIKGVWGPVLLSLTAALALSCPARVRAAELEVGQSAPAFELPDENGHIHRLADYKGKTLVLAFYPKDFTGG
jgi:peroxiredoxin Q/BCP